MRRRELLFGAAAGAAVAALGRAAAAADMPIFDSHAHLISPDRQRYPPSPLGGAPVREGDFDDPITAERLIREMDQNGVARACAVQRAFIYGFDNSYIIDSGDRHPDRLSPVIVLDGVSAETPAKLRALAAAHRLGGFRLSNASVENVDLGWLNSAEAMAVWRTAADLHLPAAVIFFRAHLAFALPALKVIAERFPALPIVIDHVGVLHASQFEVQWAERHGHSNEVSGAPDYGVTPALRRLAELPNVYFKFTPINFEQLDRARIPHEDFVRALVGALGADKLMWGSDVGQTRGPYAPKVAAARRSVSRLSRSDQRQVLYETAARVYPLAARS